MVWDDVLYGSGSFWRAFWASAKTKEGKPRQQREVGYICDFRSNRKTVDIDVEKPIIS